MPAAIPGLDVEEVAGDQDPLEVVAGAIERVVGPPVATALHDRWPAVLGRYGPEPFRHLSL